MEIERCYFVTFMTVVSLLSTKTVTYGASRIPQNLQVIEDDIHSMRENITILFEKIDQLNKSAVESSGMCIIANVTSSQPVTDRDGRNDTAKVNCPNMSVKDHILVKQSVTDKQTNGDLQSQLRSVRNMLFESEKMAGDRNRELRNRLLHAEKTISDIDRDDRKGMTLMEKAIEKDQEIDIRLQSLEDIVSDIRNNLTLINIAIERMDIERDQVLQSRLQSIDESIENRIADIYADISKNISSFMATISNTINKDFVKADTNCTTVRESGVYTFNLESRITVYCDQDTDDGGWLVFMRRQDGSEDFYRSWSDYKHGFGSPDGEFWAGNELLHNLTKARPMQLRIDLEDFEGNTSFAMYEEFQIGPEEDKYRLHVRGYNGTAGDSLIDPSYPFHKHVGMQFSTYDSDNDNYTGNCAEFYMGAWWYNWCFAANLNGIYTYDHYETWRQGILWGTWKGWEESLKRVEMKIR